MRPIKTKQALLLLFLLLTPWSRAACSFIVDGYSTIVIKDGSVQGVPRGDSIEAYINGHFLTVTFTEYLGDVQVEVTTASGSPVDYRHVWTPDSFAAQIVNTGEYIVTITLPNGDEYYGEFEVTD